MSNYRDLVFYQKAQQVTKGIHALIKVWPKTMQTQEISRQLFRSSTSVGANIAEGHGRHQGVEYVHYLIIAQGSANETDHWLHIALDCEPGPLAEVGKLIELNGEVIRMVTATISTLRTKQGTSIAK